MHVLLLLYYTIIHVLVLLYYITILYYTDKTWWLKVFRAWYKILTFLLVIVVCISGSGSCLVVV